VKAARANLKRAGLAGRVTVERRSLGEEHGPPPGPGLLVTNPPYGQRLSEENAVRALYVELAEEMRVRYGGWEAAVLCATTAPRDDSASTGSRAVQAWASILGLGASTALRNGPLDCHLLRGALAAASPSVAEPGSAGADMFGNRLRKNRKSLGRWARKNGITCYRLYDADMPEYAVAVDLYEAQQLWVHVQEYRAPASVDPQRAAQRLQEALRTIAQVLEIPRSQLHLKVREKQRGSSQYERLGAQGVYHEVREADQTLFVNFTDYLDTGLFLDHRPTRALIRELAAGRDFLNLFAYTGTASVHAAAGGATSTTSVDLSRPYLDWARRNLERNGFHRPVHDVVQADCLDWLQRTHRRRWGLIFVDPPTFSNSKRMDRTFDVQRDHADLIGAAAQLLTDDGVLLFSTNFRRFELDETALSRFHCQDISRQTLPRDFERSPRVHRCYRIESAPQ
jgi:23S rRNA (guanine2445-N2)-methyltransferase / 23S rRNA (guanine2069-N7)-methyltransferase